MDTAIAIHTAIWSKSVGSTFKPAAWWRTPATQDRPRNNPSTPECAKLTHED